MFLKRTVITVEGNDDTASNKVGLKFFEKPGDVIVHLRDVVFFNCSAWASSPRLSDDVTVSYSWRNDGEPIAQSDGVRRILQNGGSLFTRNVLHSPQTGRTDEGRYQCVAWAEGIGAIVSRPARLRIAGSNGEGYCYKAILEAMTWDVATARCRQDHSEAHPACVLNRGQNDYIVNYLSKFRGLYLISVFSS